MEKEFESKNFTDEALVAASSETMGGHPSQKSLWAQSELTRRLMVSIRSFDKSTSEYSQRIFTLTFVLLIVALAQLAVSVFALPIPFYPWSQLIIWLILLGFVLWEVKKLSERSE